MVKTVLGNRTKDIEKTDEETCLSLSSLLHYIWNYIHVLFQ